jgi:putative addiction module killer protein
VIEIRQHVARSGVVPFDRWFQGLDDAVQARITVALDRVERGSFSAGKIVGAGVSGLRLDFGSGYRIYFGRECDRIVILLAGGTKKRQQNDIEAAKAL